jgi:hypothetical protein
MFLIPRRRSSRLSAASHRRYRLAGAASAVTVVATLFAVAPAASAATSAQVLPVSAQIGNHSPATHIGLVPAIQTRGCYATVVHNWVHIYRVNPGTDICVGFTGTISLAASNTYEFCAGNNSGSFKYHYSGRPTTTQKFSRGYEVGFGVSTPVTITSITITGWSGSFDCPP